MYLETYMYVRFIYLPFILSSLPLPPAPDWHWGIECIVAWCHVAWCHTLITASASLSLGEGQGSLDFNYQSNADGLRFTSPMFSLHSTTDSYIQLSIWHFPVDFQMFTTVYWLTAFHDPLPSPRHPCRNQLLLIFLSLILTQPHFLSLCSNWCYLLSGF